MAQLQLFQMQQLMMLHLCLRSQNDCCKKGSTDLKSCRLSLSCRFPSLSSGCWAMKKLRFSTCQTQTLGPGSHSSAHANPSVIRGRERCGCVIHGSLTYSDCLRAHVQVSSLWSAPFTHVCYPAYDSWPWEKTPQPLSWLVTTMLLCDWIWNCAQRWCCDYNSWLITPV